MYQQSNNNEIVFNIIFDIFVLYKHNYIFYP